MNKKILLMLIIFNFLYLPATAQVLVPNFIKMFSEDYYYYIGYNGQLFECNTITKEYRNITHRLYIDSYGFLRLKTSDTTDRSVHEQERDIYLILSPKQFFIKMSHDRIWHFKDLSPEYGFEKLYISDIRATSYYTETISGNVISYAPQNLLQRFFSTDQEYRYELWPNSIPFVVSESDLSTCRIQVEFSSSVNGILILNGFVDFFRPKLYFENSRVASITISGVDVPFIKTYQINDIIQFQELTFPVESKVIEITINSIFPGSKYSDVCISSIAPVFNSIMLKESKTSLLPEYRSFVNNMILYFKEIK